MLLLHRAMLHAVQLDPTGVQVQHPQLVQVWQLGWDLAVQVLLS